MRNLLRASVLTVLALASTAGRSSADIVFELRDVNLSFVGMDAGTLTGSFTTNDARTEVLSIDIQTEARSFGGGAWTFTAMHYDDSYLPDASVNASPGLFEVVIGASSEIRLNFNGGLNASGDSPIFANVSYETQPTGGNRVVSSGYVTATTAAAVPEPSSIAMGAVAIGAAGLAVRRRRAT
ncbi:PEP-CTERM sorting domain-containing protein [Paludisphaera sp.]|uniref:PEP-CTERM sorting domain-containing protein n=1 Tax=Paludisphaera sp. TaxID=2017432 RepID=UPI00301B94A5